MGTLRGERQVPDGLRYAEDFLPQAQEAALIQAQPDPEISQESPVHHF